VTRRRVLRPPPSGSHKVTSNLSTRVERDHSGGIREKKVRAGPKVGLLQRTTLAVGSRDMAHDWLHRLGVVAIPSGHEGMTDGQLLGRFLSQGDAPALEALIRRHGPLVLSVCRRMLRRDQDVEDAFQATFLVLIRKASKLAGVEMIGNWLYGVSYRTAFRVRAASFRAAELERRYSWHAAAATPPPQPEVGGELAAILDDAVHGLPRKYREPVVLCLMQDLSRAEAARRLGVKEGTLSGRLARAKEMLADRLRRRGVTLSAAGLTICLSVGTASAVVSSKLLAVTVRSAGRVWFSPADPTPPGTADAVRLHEEVVREMVRVKFGVWLAAAGSLVAAGLLVTALIGKTVTREGPTPPSPGPVAQPGGAPLVAGPALRSSHRKFIEDTRWVLSELDVAKSTLSVTDSLTPPGPGLNLIARPNDGVAPAGIRLEHLPVAGGAVVVLDGVPAKLDDLRPGMLAELKLGGPGHTVVKVTAARPRPGMFSCVLERVEADRRQIWVRVIETNLLVEGLEVAADAVIIKIESGADPAPRLKSVRLQDLEVGMSLSLHVTAQGGALVVTQIQTGLVKVPRE
jgi:RNA polymerase sigma factor (sigma-70 family)